MELYKYCKEHNKNKEDCDNDSNSKNKNTDNQTRESRINDATTENENGRLSYRLDMINYAHFTSPGTYNNPGYACQLHR